MKDAKKINWLKIFFDAKQKNHYKNSICFFSYFSK